MTKAKKGIYFLSALLLLLVFPLPVSAQGELTVAVSTSVSCDQVDFTIDIAGGAAPYNLLLEFGDEETYSASELTEAIVEVSHIYPAQGEYEWKITVQDGDGLSVEAEGIVSLDGPSVILSSDPFPPLLTIDSGEASIDFLAEVSGGSAPYTYQWDLDGDGSADSGLEGDTASHTYTEGGDFKAAVTVTDSCGFTASDILTVVVVDPEGEPEEACHPTAQKIADAVNSLFPDRAEQIYTCEDIFGIFDGSVFGYQVGFGRMWHAYQLTQTIDDLTWEDIRDWHLNYSGWGALVQLDRFADLLDTYGIQNLMDLVTSGENSLGDIRTAVRSVLRYEADFEDALQRINEGASPGELGQFYKLASGLEVDPSILDSYLADGMTLPELRHAANFAERVGADWSDIVDAKAFDNSWGEIGQAYRLADDGASAADILAMGLQEYRVMQREDSRTEREEERTAREEERAQRTAKRLAEQFELQLGDVMALYNGQCEGSWGCVRDVLREETRAQSGSERDKRTAAKIASQYGVSEDEVWSVFGTSCGQDWNCVRAHFRELARGERGKGKNK